MTLSSCYSLLIPMQHWIVFFTNTKMVFSCFSASILVIPRIVSLCDSALDIAELSNTKHRSRSVERKWHVRHPQLASMSLISRTLATLFSI